MSILDQRKLIESIHPFELLSSFELDNLMKKIDIAYYTKDTLLISPSIKSIAFYIIIKGQVREYIDDELYNIYNEGDSFDADSLIYDKTVSKFIVAEDLICYEIRRDDFLDLIQNRKIQSYFLQDFISRHKQLKEYALQSELTPFLVAKVSDIYLHTACIVPETSSIYDALEKQKKLKANIIAVEGSDGLSIVSDTNLKEHVLLGEFSVDDAIANIVTKDVISVEKSEFLFNALLLMTQHKIKRLIVFDEAKVVGVLEQLDLLSFFANHSHLVAVQIDKAESIKDLKELQKDLRNLIFTLDVKGVKIRYITKLVATLNAKVYAKVFELFVESDLRSRCALIVMGSEGREEQSLKSDQDNALIIKDEADRALFESAMLKVNSALLEIGFPPCKGGVMVSNPAWRKTVKEYKAQINEWSQTLNEEELQNLSIFLDAKCVAGEFGLLHELQEYLFKVFENRDDVLAHFAKATLYFETPISLFHSFKVDVRHDNQLDLKKGGIFALVHGVRSLALKYKIEKSNTIERIKELHKKNVFDKNFATELIECFDTLSSIRLKTMLTSQSVEAENFIDPNSLSKIQRDLLKDSFKIVNAFKKFISFHFHLEMVS